MDENMIYLSGKLAETPVFSHESHGRKFMKMVLAVERLSGTTDYLPIQVVSHLLEQHPLLPGDEVSVRGHMRSYNNKSGVGNRLVLSVLAREVFGAHNGHQNQLMLTGTLCKPPIFRVTPLGREICDMLLAVSRFHGRSDYLPCLTWGTQAKRASRYAVGDQLQLKGRLQSRGYTKREGGEDISKIAYEISVTALERLAQVQSPDENYLCQTLS